VPGGARVAESPAHSLFPHHRWNEGGEAVAAKQNSLVSPRDALRATQARGRIDDDNKAREGDTKPREVTETSRQGRQEPPQARARFDDNIEAAGNSAGSEHKYDDAEQKSYDEGVGSDDEDGEAVERLALQLALVEAEEEVEVSRKSRSPRVKSDETRGRAERGKEKREYELEIDGKRSKSKEEGQPVKKGMVRGRDHHHRLAPETDVRRVLTS
jgi:hypothetical protein